MLKRWGELTDAAHAGSTRLSVEAMAAAPLLFATSWSHSNVQQPMEQVEQWAAAAGGGFQLEAAHDLPGADMSATVALLPELCNFRRCVLRSSHLRRLRSSHPQRKQWSAVRKGGNTKDSLHLTESGGACSPERSC